MGDGEFRGTQRFRIERKLGEGGMGAVYEVYDNERGESVALKTLLALDPSALLRFKREFRALANVVHPNLVTLYELVSEAGQWFFTMERIHGVDFLSHVRALSPSELCTPAFRNTSRSAATLATGDKTIDLSTRSVAFSTAIAPESEAQSPAAKLELLRPALRQLVEALVALHDSGHVHCDIKPSNIMVTPEGRVVLLDFGIVAELGKTNAADGTRNDSAGTPLYMAPELASNSTPSPAHDWYSLGIVLYQALTGRRPFFGTPSEIFISKKHLAPAAPRDCRPDVPEDLNDLCVALLEADPERRPGAREILRRLGSTAEVRVSGQNPDDGLVGRNAEFEALTQAFDAMRKGKGSAVLVRGPSGFGKSSLVEQFLNGLPKDVVLLAGRCYEREAVPFKALDNIVDALSGLLSHWPADKVRAAVPTDAAALVHVFPVLRRVDSLSVPGREDFVQGEQLKRRAFDALAELLGKVAAQTPLVVFIDDLQWGDAESAPFFIRLMNDPPPPLLLIGTYRSEEFEASPFLQSLLAPGLQTSALRKNLTLVDVGPLPMDAAVGFARSLLGPLATQAGLAERIAKQSEGSPYFVQEFVRVTHAMGLEATRDLTLDEMILARTIALSEGARGLLEAVAVAGWRVPQVVLQRAAKLDAEHHRALAELRSGHFVRTSGTGEGATVEPYHDRVRVALATSLGEDRERLWHGRLAASLDGWMGDDKPELMYPLANHFFLTRDPANAKRAYEVNWIAGRMSASAFAVDRGLHFLRQAKDIASGAGFEPSLEFEQLLGETCAVAGQMEQAMVHLGHALARSTDPLQRGRLRLGISKVHLGRLDTAASRAEVSRALAELGLRAMQVSPKDVLHALWKWAKAYSIVRDPSRFGSSSVEVRPWNRAVASAYQLAGVTAYFQMDLVAMALNFLCGYEPAALLGPSLELAETYSALGAVAGAKRKTGLAMRLTARSVEIAEKLANPAMLARAHLFGSYAFHFVGKVVEAAERMGESLERYGRYLENVDYLTGCADLSWNMLMRGYPNEGWHWVQNGLQRAARGGQSRLTKGHTYHCYAGPLLTMRGRHAEGLAHLDSFYAVIAETPQDSWRWAQYLAHRALTLVLEGRIDDELEGIFARHALLALSPGKVPLQLRQFYVARAYARLWQFERASPAQRPTLERAFRSAHQDLKRTGKHETLRVHWLVIGAGFERAKGRADKAAQTLDEAERLARQYDNPWVLAEVAEERARLARLHSNDEAARSFAASALSFATSRGWASRQARIRNEFGLD